MNSLLPPLAVGERVVAADGPDHFAIVASHLQPHALGTVLAARRAKLHGVLTKQTELIGETIGRFEEYFRRSGHRSPLKGQFKSTLTRGLPKVPPAIEALLMCEMTTGVLMGVQDLDTVVGTLMYDLAEEGETFEGFRETTICGRGEPILRDDETIVASLFQGPDKKTSVTSRTKKLLFYIFDAPGLEESVFDAAVRHVEDLLVEAHGGPERRILSLRT